MAPTEERDVERALGALTRRLDALATPFLLFDMESVEHNIDAMVRFTGAARWRPHVKTHKHRAVLGCLLDAGVTTFKCATLDELHLVLSSRRPVDVLVAYPLPPASMRAAAVLAARHPTSTVRVLLDSPEHLETTDAVLRGAPARLSAMLDVDVGMGRTGTPADRWGRPSAQNLDLVGLHGYEGHVTWVDAAEANRGYAALRELAADLPFPVRWIVTSGTHAFHHALANDGLREGAWTHQVSPGTLVLNDVRSADASELLGLRQAAFVVSRVVSRVARRATLDAGSKSLNPDCTLPGCRPVGFPQLAITSRSEEHLVCDVGPHPLSLGDHMALVPEHVCTTVNLFRVAQLVRGSTDLGSEPVTARSRSHDLEAFRAD